MNINIDFNKANTKKSNFWRGLGMVSANNSSRLLLDYKYEHPEIYKELLELMFDKSGCGINHLKIEMGADINSSSGTEPCTMRFENEKCDVRRGAGFVLAADAKKINPDLTLDMLWWGEPRWVSDSKDIYAARYKWYRENLIAAFEVFGLVFDYVSVTQNERGWDRNWMVYLSEHLKAEINVPYDFSKIKLVAGDEVCTWIQADDLMLDEVQRKAIDVVGTHYSSDSTENAKKLIEYGKELWLSEGSSPMRYAKGCSRFDEVNSGLMGLNGALDVASRIISMYASGRMTLYEIQPVISSYYDGVTYCSKQLITANEPWSGHYYLDSGYFMVQHFSNFLPKGWQMIDEACNADGKIGGDGHCLEDAKYTFITGCSPDKKDFSTILCNNTSDFIDYEIVNSDFKNKTIYLWETCGPENKTDSFDKNYFKKIEEIKFSDNGIINFKMKPYSLVSISSLNIENPNKNLKNQRLEHGKLLNLPYFDDFSYKNYEKNYLLERSGAPRFMTDEGGAFEICELNGEKVLQQKITREMKANEWGWTANPVTNFGDDRWYNYSASIDVLFENSADDCYAGIGIRYSLPDAGESGWWIQLFGNKVWKLNKGKQILLEGHLEKNLSNFTKLKISACDNKISAYIDNEKIADTDAESLNCSIPLAGRAAIYSSYDKNCFKNLKIEPAEEKYYITRINNTDENFTYEGNWEQVLMDSFKYFRRTCSIGRKGDKLYFDFSGSEVSFNGVCEREAILKVTVDSKIYADNLKITKKDFKESLFLINNLEKKEHKISLEIISGEIKIDTAEIIE